MSDRDHAEAALEQLLQIDPEAHPDPELRSEYEDAVTAVRELSDRLERARTEQEDIDEIETPDEWADEDEWQDRLEDAYDEAGIAPSKGTLTTKTIDGRDYYYLQWREGDTVTSQYVAPVDPA